MTGFQKFPDTDFQALGLNNNSISALHQVAGQEATHVTFLQTALKAAGQTPVEPCTYNFAFTNASGMVATAKVLEAVGVSAYLGAAPLINNTAILGTAATIATVEAVSLL
jgi:Ferritin-like domain